MLRGIVSIVLVASMARAELLVSSFNNSVVLRYDHVAGTLPRHADLPSDVAGAARNGVRLRPAALRREREQRPGPALQPHQRRAAGHAVHQRGPARLPGRHDAGPRRPALREQPVANDSILRYDATNAAFVDVFRGARAAAASTVPSGVAFGPGRHTCTWPAATPPTRSIATTARAAPSSTCSSPTACPSRSACRFGPDGHLYVANGNSNHVARFDGASGAFLDIFTSGGATEPARSGLAFGPDTNLYVANYGGVTPSPATTGPPAPSWATS
jgi:hypothetical protein